VAVFPTERFKKNHIDYAWLPDNCYSGFRSITPKSGFDFLWVPPDTWKTTRCGLSSVQPCS